MRQAAVGASREGSVGALSAASAFLGDGELRAPAQAHLSVVSAELSDVCGLFTKSKVSAQGPGAERPPGRLQLSKSATGGRSIFKILLLDS